MQVLCLHGSPRRGSHSAALGEAFCRAAAARGASVSTHRLADLDYGGCRACMACKGERGTCVVRDGLEPVMEEVRRAEILALTTPVYFGEVTAQLKAFIDRTYHFLPPDYGEGGRSRLSPGRKLLLFQTQGNPDEEAYADIFPRYEFFFRWFGYEDNHLVRACGTGPGAETPALAAAMERARELAHRLIPPPGT